MKTKGKAETRYAVVATAKVNILAARSVTLAVNAELKVPSVFLAHRSRTWADAPDGNPSSAHVARISRTVGLAGSGPAVRRVRWKETTAYVRAAESGLIQT